MLKWFHVVRCLLLNTAVSRRSPTLLERSWNSSAIRATWWLEKTVVGATPRPSGAGESGAIPSASVSPFIHLFKFCDFWLVTIDYVFEKLNYDSIELQSSTVEGQKSQIFVSKISSKVMECPRFPEIRWDLCKRKAFFFNLIKCVCVRIPQNSFNFYWGSCCVQLVRNVCH